MTYDPNNIFAKILRGEIPNNTVYEDDVTLAFRDIAPKAKTHILLIPKGAYIDSYDFHANASAHEISGFYAAFTKIIAQENLEQQGFRTVSNSGDHGGQEVPHFHLHILGGEKLNLPF